MTRRSSTGWTALVVLALVGSTTSASDVAHAVSTTRCAPRVVYTSAHARAGAGGGPTRFTDVTATLGAVDPLSGMRAHAVATGDVNGDGWTDMFVGTFADRPLSDYQVRGADGPAPDRLLLGGVEGFRVADGFPETRGRTSGAAFVDLNGDERLDLVIARNIREGLRADAPTEVLRNEGDGRFVRAATLPVPVGARSIGLLDHDTDGRTDLFVTEDRWSGGSSVLLHNEGDFRFTDVTAVAGLPTDLAGMGVATADLTGDGVPELFVGGANRLFSADADGRFHAVSTTSFDWPTFGDEDDPAGVAAGDVDRDGRIDLVVGQHYGSTVDFGRRVPVRLYLNSGTDASGDPVLDDVTDDAGLTGLPTRAPHVEIADFDADGWPDVLASAADATGAPMVFRNSGVVDGSPRFVAPEAGPDDRYWPSGALLDVDRDGRLDVVLADFEPDRASLVLRNEGPSGHWVAVQAPPGTRVEVRESTAGGARLGTGVVDSSTGFGGGAPPVSWFGVGSHERVTVRIELPDGRAFRMSRLRVDRLVDPSGCLGR